MTSPDLAPTSPRARCEDHTVDLAPTRPSRRGGEVERQVGSGATERSKTSTSPRGEVTYQHPGAVQRKAELAVCGGCGHPVLHAVVDGLDVQADPWALTQPGELLARLAGRLTYNAHIDGYRNVTLSFRFAYHISHNVEWPALSDHSCAPPLAPIDNEKSEQLFAAMLDQPKNEGGGPCPF